MPIPSWIIGAIIVVFGSIVSNFGINLQKRAHNTLAKLGKTKLYLKSPLWIAGIFCVIVGSISDFAALSFAPQSLVTPLGSTTLIANVIFAHFWLGETLISRDLLGTAVVILGAILSTYSADHAEQHYKVGELLSLFTEFLFLAYFMCLCLFVAVLSFILYKEKKNINNNSTLIMKNLIPICYASLSGIIGAQSVLLAKCVGTLILASLSGDNQFLDLTTYVIIIALVLTVIIQTHLLNLGLKDYDALLVFPIFQIFWILFSVLGGLFFFQELYHFSILNACLFSTSILMISCGVYVLSQREVGGLIYCKFTSSVMVVLFAQKLRQKALKSKGKLPSNEKELQKVTISRKVSFPLSLTLGARTALLISSYYESESDEEIKKEELKEKVKEKEQVLV